jgi:hypothetical protein
MNYKCAMEFKTTEASKQETTLVKLTNPFVFLREPKVVKTEGLSLREIAAMMRQRWEAHHERNGTWYDYSDNESWCSDDEEADDDEYEHNVDE